MNGFLINVHLLKKEEENSIGTHHNEMCCTYLWPQYMPNLITKELSATYGVLDTLY
jgi:hypothetical protein